MKTTNPILEQPSINTVSSGGTIYLVFTTQGAGGAEKRLTGSWLLMKQKGVNVKLVCCKELFDALCKQTEFRDLIGYEKDIIILPLTGKAKKDTNTLKNFIREIVVSGDKLHFVGFFPVSLKKKRGVEYLYSFTSCSFNIVNIKGKILFAGAFLRADKVDVLDPIIYKTSGKILFYKKDRIFQTSNSYVDVEKFAPQFPKKNWIVFLGRFVECKQTLRYVKCLPYLHEHLLKNGIQDHHFYILGYGPQEEEIKNELEATIYAGIPFTLKRSHEPEQILCYSKVFLSLQSFNNYPSKSLLEASSAGNIPVVTDVGTTELIAPREYSGYVPKDFSAEDLYRKIEEILSMNEQQFAAYSGKAREFVLENSTLEKMSEYYLKFYLNN